jgi:hypothetical protein
MRVKRALLFLAALLFVVVAPGAFAQTRDIDIPCLKFVLDVGFSRALTVS